MCGSNAEGTVVDSQTNKYFMNFFMYNGKMNESHYAGWVQQIKQFDKMLLHSQLHSALPLAFLDVLHLWERLICEV